LQAVFILNLSNTTAPDPDGEQTYWSPNNIAPVGTFQTNYTRFTSPALTQALNTGKTDPSKKARIAAYQKVGRIFGTEVPYIWLNGVLDILAFGSKVLGLSNPTTPEGTRLYPVSSYGPAWLTQVSLA
jgi:ABC-type transport system substrate-binding protein